MQGILAFYTGRGNSGDNDVGPILLPPRDYDTVHRHRGNLAGIEFRRCLNQTIVGGSTTIDRGGTRSAASSGIGSDSAATPPPYQSHHPLGPRPSRPSRDSSSGEWIILYFGFAYCMILFCYLAERNWRMFDSCWRCYNTTFNFGIMIEGVIYNDDWEIYACSDKMPR